MPVVYTIGHSTHPLDYFVELLRRHDVTAVADVRSQPYSRFNPDYNAEALQAYLSSRGVEYVFLGKELGARSSDPDCYVDGKVQYERIAKTALFRSGLERVTQGAQRYAVALLCAEKEPLSCHRTVLIARRLAEAGVEVRHILADGGLERHEDTVKRLLEELRMPEKDLFRSFEEIVEDAYRQQERRIAFEMEQSDPTRPAGAAWA